ncbi:MAG: DNA adenine methylase [Actinomycetota bacterium]|nr:DNA adenine methylase [Actinomycetota bacterium]
MAEIDAGETSARVLRYPGSKWGLARQIVSLMPEHVRYLEPFLGSGAAFFTKPRAAFETVNDLDGEVFNLFSLLRDERLREQLVEAVEFTAYAEDELLSLRDALATDDPVERARRLLVRSWQDFAGLRPHGDSMTFRWAGSGTQTERPAHVWARLPERISAAARRLKDAQVLRRDAVEVIEAHRDPRVLVYADPPYLRSTRTEDYYAHETDDAFHERLLGALLRHPGPVLLSGHASALYEDALAGWERTELLGRRQGMRRGRKGYEDTEIVWRNPAASGHAGDPMRPLFDAG